MKIKAFGDYKKRETGQYKLVSISAKPNETKYNQAKRPRLKTGGPDTIKQIVVIGPMPVNVVVLTAGSMAGDGRQRAEQ